MRSPNGRLELTWMGKDMALIPTSHGKYDDEWADPADPCEGTEQIQELVISRAISGLRIE